MYLPNAETLREMEIMDTLRESDIILRRVIRNSDEHLAKFGTGKPAPKVDKYCTECGARLLATDRTECDCGEELK
jgi:hypothetical protein